MRRPWYALRPGKLHQLTMSLMALGPEKSSCVIARYAQELSQLKEEMSGLRSALMRSEAMLLERSAPVPVIALLCSQQGEIADRSMDLTRRQHEILKLVLDGHPSKNIAADLGISRRTVENHRAAIMKKTGSKSLPALGRFGFMASRASAAESAGHAFATAGATSHF